MKTFEELEVYKKAFEFVVTIYKLTENSKMNRNIVNQLERAALSITNNIAEGFELQSNKQFVKFLYISKGSSGECRNLLALANELNQIDSKIYEDLNLQLVSITKQIAGFVKYLEKSEIR